MDEFVFRKGEYRLPRNVWRWLKRRMGPITRPKLRKAIEAFATAIGRYHTGPKVQGREFGLCWLKLKDMHPWLTEWPVREATAFLREMGFIERVTPPNRLREIAGWVWRRSSP